MDGDTIGMVGGDSRKWESSCQVSPLANISLLVNRANGSKAVKTVPWRGGGTVARSGNFGYGHITCTYGWCMVGEDRRGIVRLGRAEKQIYPPAKHAPR